MRIGAIHVAESPFLEELAAASAALEAGLLEHAHIRDVMARYRPTVAELTGE
jgi:hypothetical protein